MTQIMQRDPLASSLARATDVRAACRVAVAHIAGPGLRPSVYVERGGRLRCQALRGYRQLLDGLAPWAGVIGHTWATGTPSVVGDVRSDPHYLEATDGVVAEACFPVDCDGRTIGAMNLEAIRPLAADELEMLEATAAALGRRIEELGGPAPESASQRLVRHAIALATEQDATALERAVIAAAIDITPLSSAMMLTRESDRDPFAPSWAHGPLEASLVRTSLEAIQTLAALVGSGCSAYTVSGDDETEGENAGIATLREAGGASVALLPVGLDRILVVAGDTTIGLSTEHCELLELLAAQASVCLRTAASVSDLRARAATDALTGLGHHATFHAELAKARRAGAVGVLMVDLDAFKEYNDCHGHPAGDAALRAAAATLSGALRRGDVLFRIGGDEFAALLPGVDDAAAEEIARRLHGSIAESALGLSVSIGVAASRVGEDEASVMSRADRALYAVKWSGRNGVALDEDALVQPAGAH